jgi:hypothetical protein
MNKEIIKLSILTFLAGVFCKIYDDINDNNLFTYLCLDKNKEYINEFLKAVHYILLVYISSDHIYALLFIMLPNIILFINDTKAFEMPYEYSGMIAFSIFSFYLAVNNFSKLMLMFNYYIIFYIVIFLLSTYIFDILLCKNLEFGYKKLAVRALAVFFTASVLLINYCFKLVPDELTFCLWYIIGYSLISCFFQIFFILKSKKQIDEQIDEPVDKLVDEPIDDKLVDEPVNEPVNKPVNEPIDKPVNEPIDKPVDEPMQNGLEKK